MKYRHLGSQPLIRVALAFDLGSPFKDFSVYYPWAQDPLLRYLNGCAVDIGLFRCSDLVNTYVGDHYDPRPVQVDFHPPIREDEDVIGRNDDTRYGSIFQNMELFATALGFVPGSRRMQSFDEHFVHHMSSHGTVVTPNSASRPWYLAKVGDTVHVTNDYNIMPADFEVNPPVSHVPDATVLRMVNQNHYEIVGDPVMVSPRPLLQDRLAQLSNMVGVDNVAPFLGSSTYQRWVVNSLSSTITEDGFDLSWSIDFRWADTALDTLLSPWYEYEISSSIHVGFERQSLDLSANLVDGDEASISNVCVMRGSYSGSYNQTGGLYHDDNPTFDGDFTHDLTFGLSCFLISNEIKELDISPDSAIAIINDRSPLSGFDHLIRARMQDVRPSSFRSFCAAGDNLVGSIDSNLIRSLSHLHDLQRLIPDLEGISESVSTSPLSLRGLRDIADVTNSEFIRASFGISPLLRLLGDLPKIYSILGQLNSLRTGPLSLYGSFKFSFPAEFGRSNGVSLLTRTKVVCNSRPSAALSKLLNLDALSIFPQPSNLWDLVPIHFVLDWTLGVSAHLRSIENLALMSMLDVGYYVHSYTFESSLIQDDFDRMRVVPDSLSQPSLKVFIREVSLVTPAPSDRGFDFFLPSSPPKWATPISLILAKIL